MWSYLKEGSGRKVFFSQLPEVKRSRLNPEIEQYWDENWTIRELVNKRIEGK
jgi:hypothetical protein